MLSSVFENQGLNLWSLWKSTITFTTQLNSLLLTFPISENKCLLLQFIPHSTIDVNQEIRRHFRLDEFLKHPSSGF